MADVDEPVAHPHDDDDNQDIEEEEASDCDSDSDDDDDDISDSVKNQLLYTVDAMKRYIRMHCVHRRGGDSNYNNSSSNSISGPLLLLDVSTVTQSLDAERLQMFGQALREDQDLSAIELSLDSVSSSSSSSPNNNAALAKDIAVFMGKSPKLASVDLSAGTTDNNGGVDIKLVRLFLHTFLRNPHARALALWDLHTQPANMALPDITKLVSTCKPLKTLKCSDCSLNVATALLQGLILQKTAINVEFNMDNWPATSGRLWQLLCENVTSLQTLRIDSLPAAALQDMAEPLARLPALTWLELVLQQQPCSDDDDDDQAATKAAQLLATVVQQTKSIQQLDLQGFDWSSSSSLSSRADMLHQALLENNSLQKLSLAGGGLHLAQALRGVSNLRDLDIAHARLVPPPQPHELKETLASLTGLKSIRLPMLDDTQVGGLLQGVQQNSCIQRLDLTFSSASPSTVQQMRETFSNHSSLCHLTMRVEGMNGNDTLIADTLSGILAVNGCPLKSLHLHGIRFTAASVDALFAALRSNTKLHTLSLDKSGLDVAGSLNICQHLPFLHYLADLSLDIPEEFDDDHEDEFVEAMEANKSLTKLNFTLEDSRLVGIAEFFVQRNKTQWMLAEENCSSSSSSSRKALWPVLLWQYDDSAKFQWVLALSDNLVSESNSNKRKSKEDPSGQESKKPSRADSS